MTRKEFESQVQQFTDSENKAGLLRLFEETPPSNVGTRDMLLTKIREIDLKQECEVGSIVLVVGKSPTCDRCMKVDSIICVQFRTSWRYLCENCAKILIYRGSSIDNMSLNCYFRKYK